MGQTRKSRSWLSYPKIIISHQVHNTCMDGYCSRAGFTITIGFCSNSFVSIPHAQALQQDPSAFWRDRIIDCPCCVLTVRVDTIWYTVSCTKSIHFSASLVELASKSANVGNTDDAGANVGNADAGAFNWSTKPVSASDVFMVTSSQLSAEPSCLIVETGVRCFLTLHTFIALRYRAFFFHNCHQLVVVVERGGLVRSSDNPSTSFSRRYNKYGGLSWWRHRKPNVSNI